MEKSKENSIVSRILTESKFFGKAEASTLEQYKDKLKSLLKQAGGERAVQQAASLESGFNSGVKEIMKERGRGIASLLCQDGSDAAAVMKAMIISLASYNEPFPASQTDYWNGLGRDILAQMEHSGLIRYETASPSHPGAEDGELTLALTDFGRAVFDGFAEIAGDTVRKTYTDMVRSLD